MRPTCLLAIAALALLPLASCSGGGPAALPVRAPLTSVLDLGALSSTDPSSVPVSFENPYASAARLVSTVSNGPFHVAEAALPIDVGAGGDVTLDVWFEPTHEGTAIGTLTLRWEGPSGPLARTYDLQAVGERVTWNVSPSTLDFGAAGLGTTVDRSVQLLNLSRLSTVTLTGVAYPSAAFDVVGSPFPLVIDPGETADLTFSYAPAVDGSDSGEIVLGPSDPGGAVTIPVRAATPGTDLEQVTEFGVQPLDSNGRTPLLSVSVPSDAISLTLEGWIPNSISSSAYIGLDSLNGPGSRVYENTTSTGDYIWFPGYEIFTTSVPNTDRSNLQLVAGGGTYRFSIRRIYGSGSAMIVRAIVERRPPDLRTVGTLDLNVWLTPGVEPTAATAATDSRLQSVLGRIDLILGGQGVRLGDVDYYDVSDTKFNEVTSDSEFTSLLQTTSAATETRLNLFFVEVAFGGGVVGVSATIGGPLRNGTGSSGVMAIYSGFTTNTIGLIAAHEIGHFLGLYHTVEQDGTHDFIDDTDECLSSGTDTVCTVTGGGYLMHWQAVGGTTITDGQGLVVRGHPLLGPGTSTAVTLSRRVVLTASDLQELTSLPRNWCGTCDVTLDSRKPAAGD